ncbi:hypothetical protein [uncultured Gemmiger sp.]|uniref:hypothetical protein n=1 Tax=uncultured Gemmiger sp. TaxID=1623490 RepID=UPI0025CBCB3A|nr:hypothetical protein [uncultured Gemmiger sp.]
MSAILAVCGENFCAMASDGRMVEEPATLGKPHILTEELPKLRKVNRNVCVGFAGDTLAAVQAVNALDEYNVQYLTFEKVVKVLCARLREINVLPLGVRFLVGGRGRKGGFQMATFSTDNGCQPEIRPAQPGAFLIEGACAHTDVAPLLDEYLRAGAEKWRTLDDIAASLEDCIRAIAARDETANDKIYRQLIY